MKNAPSKFQILKIAFYIFNVAHIVNLSELIEIIHLVLTQNFPNK